MASIDWPYYTTTNTTYTYAPTVTTSSGTIPWVITSGGGGGSAPAPRPPTALEWLDAETEAVCKLARLVGSGTA